MTSNDVDFVFFWQRVIQNYVWHNALKNGSGKTCRGQPLTHLKWCGQLQQKIFKGCLPQILLGSFLNALSYISLCN